MLRVGQVQMNGIIPAYAGSTFSIEIRPEPLPDHPRVCGEHSGSPSVLAFAQGSSPRMRGALGRIRQDVLWPGIIPAYAGSTSGILLDSDGRVDHPRVCGEHSTFDDSKSLRPGSSPRMRGARIHHRRSGQAVRIIPAYAGSTK